MRHNFTRVEVRPIGYWLIYMLKPIASCDVEKDMMGYIIRQAVFDIWLRAKL